MKKIKIEVEISDNHSPSEDDLSNLIEGLVINSESSNKKKKKEEANNKNIYTSSAESNKPESDGFVAYTIAAFGERQLTYQDPVAALWRFLESDIAVVQAMSPIQFTVVFPISTNL